VVVDVAAESLAGGVEADANLSADTGPDVAAVGELVAGDAEAGVAADGLEVVVDIAAE
jgi:hypothetical protein